MKFTFAANPIDYACENHACKAAAGDACRTVGRHISASPHALRLRAAIAATGKPGRHETERDLWDAACRRYLQGILLELLGRHATDDELARARRDGSLRTDRGWFAALLQAKPVAARRLPTKRRLYGGAVTLWGRVTHEEQLPSGGFVLQLHTGEYVHMPADMWRELWPERKCDRAELEKDHAELRGGWWRFTIHREECTAADDEPDRDEGEPAAPAIVPGQMAMF